MDFQVRFGVDDVFLCSWCLLYRILQATFDKTIFTFGILMRTILFVLVVSTMALTLHLFLLQGKIRAVRSFGASLSFTFIAMQGPKF